MKIETGIVDSKQVTFGDLKPGEVCRFIDGKQIMLKSIVNVPGDIGLHFVQHTFAVALNNGDTGAISDSVPVIGYPDAIVYRHLEKGIS